MKAVEISQSQISSIQLKAVKIRGKQRNYENGQILPKVAEGSWMQFKRQWDKLFKIWKKIVEGKSRAVESTQKQFKSVGGNWMQAQQAKSVVGSYMHSKALKICQRQ